MAVSCERALKVKCKKKSAQFSGVVKKRKGGTSIQSPIVFSPDSEYLFMNSCLGVKVFSAKTGECVKIFETLLSGYGRVLSVIIIDNHPVIVSLDETNRIFLLHWDIKTSDIKKRQEIKLPKKYRDYVGVYALLVPAVSNRCAQDLCLVIGNTCNVHCVLFYNTDTLKILQHPLNDTDVGFGVGKQYLSFGGGPDSRLMATVTRVNGLCVYSLDGTKKQIGIFAGKNLNWSSICCHPTEPSVAAGDTLGRCVLFRNPLMNPKVKTIFHWHTLPCDVIAFTPAGCTMYTGGGEHVLVKWNVENPNVKNFLPRLSAPLVHITLAPDNSLAAVSTLDNGVILVESSHRVAKVLEQLAWGVLSHKDSKLFPAGLIFDPISRSVVLNSRPGHLQFYCPETEHLTLVDICQQNYLTQERDRGIVNTDVTLVALSSDSAWMATVETRQEDGSSLELRLKFWEHQSASKWWMLNSVVDMPHGGPVGCLKFQPLSALPNSIPEYLVVTTGEDFKFRLWSPSPIDSVYKKGFVWKCEGAASYKDHPVGPACFSQDGSLLAVAFQHILTLWSSDSIKFKTSLSRFSSHIKQVEFGRDICSHLLVASTKTGITVWNLLTLCVHWTANVRPSLLIANPSSCFMAVISNKTKQMFVFNPMHSKLLHVEKNLCGKNADVLGASFARRECENWKAPQWLFKSIFYYIDSDQELISVESVDDSNSTGVVMVGDDEKSTLFSDLKRIQSVSKRKTHDDHPRRHQYGVIGSTAIKEFLQAPCYSMAPVSALCTSLLEAFSLSKRPFEEKGCRGRWETDGDGSDEGIGNGSDSRAESSDEPEDSSEDKPSHFSSPSSASPWTDVKSKADDLFFIDFEDGGIHKSS